MTPPDSATKTNIITDTTLVADLNENNNNNTKIAVRSKYRENLRLGDIFETKTSFGGFESTNTSDYEEEEAEEDTIPETSVGESSETDKNLEICIIPDNCQLIKVQGASSNILQKNAVYDNLFQPKNLLFLPKHEILGKPPCRRSFRRGKNY